MFTIFMVLYYSFLALLHSHTAYLLENNNNFVIHIIDYYTISQEYREIYNHTKHCSIGYCLHVYIILYYYDVIIMMILLCHYVKSYTILIVIRSAYYKRTCTKSKLTNHFPCFILMLVHVNLDPINRNIK